MDYEQWLENRKTIEIAIENKDFNKAKIILAKQLEAATNNVRNWNTDNIIHVSHTYLGIIALEENNIKVAKEHLIKSIEIKGSPQIKSFGPNTKLAEKLLEIGEREVVLDYLDRSRTLWFFITRIGKLRKWKKALKNNKFPGFGANSVYHLK